MYSNDPFLRTKLVKRQIKPQAPATLLNGPGIQRVANLCAVLSIKKSTFYTRLRSGLILPPDGFDGRPFWNNSTVIVILAGLSGARDHGTTSKQVQRAEKVEA